MTKKMTEEECLEEVRKQIYREIDFLKERITILEEQCLDYVFITPEHLKGDQS